MCASVAVVPADPHVVLVVDEDAVIRLRPFVAGARPAPVADEIARRVELQHRRRAAAARRRRRILIGGPFDRVHAIGPVHDPDVVLPVDTEANRLSEHPVVRQRFGPERIDFKPRRLDGRLRGNRSIERPLRDPEGEERGQERRARQESGACHRRPPAESASPLNANFCSRLPSYVSPVYRLPCESTAMLPTP